jgi:hypothetical protein
LGAIIGIAVGWTFWHWAQWRLRRLDQRRSANAQR